MVCELKKAHHIFYSYRHIKSYITISLQLYDIYVILLN